MIYFTNQLTVITDTGCVFLKNGDKIKELPTGGDGDIYIKVYSEERYLNINYDDNIIEFSANLRLSHNNSKVVIWEKLDSPFKLKKEDAFTIFSWNHTKFYIYLIEDRRGLKDIFIIQRSLIDFEE